MCTVVTPIEIICIGCGRRRTVKPTAKNEPRTPTGWKRHAEAYHCDDCWSKSWILRAITLPVASPLESSWKELREGLRLMWADTTACANRIMTECYARDVRRTGKERQKMPSMPRVYLYPELRQEFPALPSQTVAALEHTVVAKYRALRYQVVWTASAALPTYRYPTPFPIPSQGWHARIEEDRPIVNLRIGERRFDLRLKSGPQFARQMAGFRLLARGGAVPGEAAIYQRTTAMGVPLLVKLVAWLPRQQAQPGTSTLRVHTAVESLLVAVNAKDEKLWTYHGMHLRRWVAEHRKALDEWADDSKYENRPVPTFADRRTAAGRKFRDRMDSATHEIAAQLAGYAARRHFAEVEYDDRERHFCQSFPYFRLASLIAEKLDARGIQFRASSPAEENIGQPLAKPEES